MEPLTGAELLAHNKSFAGSLKEAAQAAGYVKNLPDGRVRISLSRYREALLAAAGVQTASSSKRSTSGRPLSFKASVLKAGHLVLGAPYLAQAGLGHGDQVHIKVSKGRLVLSSSEE